MGMLVYRRILCVNDGSTIIHEWEYLIVHVGGGGGGDLTLYSLAGRVPA